ncbi:MAG: YqgE/AlgH family protein [Gammaproteobacteria bacterium]
MRSAYLTGQLLVAMPALADPNFRQTVTYLCEHTSEGALGIVINRPLELTLGEIFSHLDVTPEDPDSSDLPVYLGGPVQTDRGFVIHQPLRRWESTLKVSDTTGLTTSQDILRDIAIGRGPGQALVALGYAGWSAGQLEQEIRDNAWLNVPADDRILFETPVEERWERAVEKLGIDPQLLSTEAGHA